MDISIEWNPVLGNEASTGDKNATGTERDVEPLVSDMHRVPAAEREVLNARSQPTNRMAAAQATPHASHMLRASAVNFSGPPCLPQTPCCRVWDRGFGV